MSASDKKRLRKEQAAAQLTERQLKELAEAKKIKRLSVTFVVIMLAIVLTAASILGFRLVNNSGIIEKNTVAAIVGEHKLNSVQMNYYLHDYIRQWSSAYGENLATYAGMMGLDVNKPISEQISNQTTGETWADHFLTDAINKAKSDYALYDKAMADGFTLSEEDENALKLNEEQLKLYATTYYGYKNVNQYLQALYGYGADLKSYNEYARISTIASAYYNHTKDALTYDDTAIRAEDEKDVNKYSSFDYTTYYLATSAFLTGGTTDENGSTTYTQEEKDAAAKEAEATANSLTVAKDVTELDALIAALEINAENKTAASTQNTHSKYSSIPTILQSWLANKERKEGDITVIASETPAAEENAPKTINGYYVVLFQDRDENLRPLANVRHLLVEFEGGTTDTSGNMTYSETQKEKAKEEAEKLLQEWKDGAATEDSFIALVKEYTDDAGSKETGGLYEDIHRESSYVETFRNWAVDSDRKAGDTDVIVSEYGYHIMYYVGDSEQTYRDYMISEDLRAADIEAWQESILKDVNAKVENTKRLNLDLVLAQM